MATVTADQEWLTVINIADSTGIKRGSVSSILTKLFRAGKVDRECLQHRGGTGRMSYLYPPAAVKLVQDKYGRKPDKVSHAVRQFGADGAWEMSRRMHRDKMAALRATLPSRVTHKPMRDCCGVENGLIAGRCWVCFRRHRGEVV